MDRAGDGAESAREQGGGAWGLVGCGAGKGRTAPRAWVDSGEPARWSRPEEDTGGQDSEDGAKEVDELSFLFLAFFFFN